MKNCATIVKPLTKMLSRKNTTFTKKAKKQNFTKLDDFAIKAFKNLKRTPTNECEQAQQILQKLCSSSCKTYSISYPINFDF